MNTLLPQAGSRFRVLTTRTLERLGFEEHAFLVLPAVLIGMIVAAAAVSFHELIVLIRSWLYTGPVASPEFLYGHGVWLLILFPAAGGLVVGCISRLFGAGGHGVPEVIESVVRTQGFMRPFSAIQKIVTASATIGSGGSAGAEGPIVQVGAAIASGVGQIFQIARQHMPILVGCGTAAGISAIFNSPIGGVLFTLEVILQEFSVRAFTPLVVASVIANVTTRAIFQSLLGHEYNAIFAMPPEVINGFGAGGMLTWSQLPNFALLGLVCGLVAASLTRLMLRMEKHVARSRIPRIYRPALGGAAVGAIGVLFITVIGWGLLHAAKPFDVHNYPMPAFMGDGYGVIQELLRTPFYIANGSGTLLLVVVVLCLAKLLATCLTLATGGSGGVIAPSLFLGASTGAAVGLLLQRLGIFPEVFPAMYALIGMGAVLAAVVHAPLASILILLELTSDYHIILPAMLATIFATGTARFIFRDSIYTVALRERGIRVGGHRDSSLLRRLTIEQIGMEPACIVKGQMPVSELIQQMAGELHDAVVVDEAGRYVGMVLRRDLASALLNPESLPLLLASEITRAGVPLLSVDDDLARALDVFAQNDTSTLAVSFAQRPENVVGVITHDHLLRKYQQSLQA